MPEWGVDVVFTESWSRCYSAELILVAHEELDTDYSKDDKHQDLEDENVEETWNGGDNCIYEHLHFFKPAQRTQWSDDT